VHARRLEDRIRDLCSQAVRAQDSELTAIFSSLQLALHEHTERIRKLAAANLATWQIRNAGTTLSPSQFQASVECTICRKVIPLEDSKVSEDGQPMHEECYVTKLTVSRHLPGPRQATSGSKNAEPDGSMQILAP